VRAGTAGGTGVYVQPGYSSMPTAWLPTYDLCNVAVQGMTVLAPCCSAA